MTWIGGIFSKDGNDRSQMRKNVSSMMESVYSSGKCSVLANPWYISSIVEDTNGRVLGQVSVPVEMRSLEPIYPDYREKLILMCDGHFYNPQTLASEFSQAHRAKRETSAESLVHLMRGFNGGLEHKVKGALTDLDGDYALAISDANQTIISRNALGTKPLYFAENNMFSAFASNKKSLWKIGFDEVIPLRAGMLAIFNHKGTSVKEVLPFREREVNIKDMTQAVGYYQEVFNRALTKRLDELDHVSKVGVLLSGGVDSCLIAKLVYDAVSDSGMEVVAYTGGLFGSTDVKFAQEFAEELGIEHKTRILSIEEVEEYIPKVIETVEDGDLVQVEAGVGIYAAVEMAAQDGISVLFSGQGPDELWGGYNWYPNVLGKDGRQELCRRMWDDFTKADVETLDRENKIAMAHGIDILFPYLDTQVANLAISVASELKVTSEEDYLGKHPHRQLAVKMGIPEKYAYREKVAAQHGTGIHDVLQIIARKNGFDADLIAEIGYENDRITTEKMGSSSRYGYRYAEEGLWQVPQHVQFFLYALAYRKGLLNKSVRDKVEYFLGRMSNPSRGSRW